MSAGTNTMYPSGDDELTAQVRAETSYDDTPDELPQSQLDTIIGRSKGRVELRTGSDQWYADNGLGFALVSYVCMRAKAAVENISLSEYTFGAETVEFDVDDPEDSQQLQQWADDIRTGLDNSTIDISGEEPDISNTADYIGSTALR